MITSYLQESNLTARQTRNVTITSYIQLRRLAKVNVTELRESNSDRLVHSP